MSVLGLLIRCTIIPVLFVFSALCFYNGFMDSAHYYFMGAIIRGAASLGLGMGLSIEFYLSWKNR